MLSHIRLFVTLWNVVCQAPLSMEFSRKSTGVSSHSLLQGIFSTQGSNSGLPYCEQVLYRLSHQGSPSDSWAWSKQPPPLMIQFRFPPGSWPHPLPHCPPPLDLTFPFVLRFRLSAPAQCGFVSTEDPVNTLSNSPMGRPIVIFFPPRALAERAFSAFVWVFLSLLVTRKVTLRESGEDKTASNQSNFLPWVTLKALFCVSGHLSQYSTLPLLSRKVMQHPMGIFGPGKDSSIN